MTLPALPPQDSTNWYAHYTALHNAANGAKDRANHTGSQTSATISDLTEAVEDIVAGLIGAGTGVSVSYDDAAGTYTISATGGSGGTTDPEVVRDAIGTALIGTGNISVAVNDAADTITISTTATANSTDAALRDRSTHTGTQAASTITGLATVATSGAYADLSGRPTIPPAYTDEQVRDVIGTALVAGSNVTITPSDAGDSITIAASGSGGTAATGEPAMIFVAASNASTTDKALADYVCDGTADNVQIQAAIDAVRTLGGWVQLSPGDFYLAARLELLGKSNENARQHIGLRGAGTWATNLRPGSGLTSAVHIANCATVSVHDMAIYVSGNTTGITSTADHVNSAAAHKSFWMSSFKNLEIWGDFSGTGTGWGMDLDSPFRAVFENIDVTGTRNGTRLYSTHNAFNPGNSVFLRCFNSIFGSNGFAWKIESTVTSGKMNILEFIMCEAISFNGSGNTAAWLGGVGPVNNTRWQMTNFEQFDTVFHVERGEDNVMDGNYWDVRNGAAANTTEFVRFGANAWNNKVSIGNALTRVATRLVVSAATRTDLPNLIEHVKLIADTGGSVTNSITTAGAVISRWVVAEGANVAQASTVLVDPDQASGGGGGVTDHGALTGLSDDDHTQYALADGSRGSFAPTSHTHTAANISDSTATGRSVLTAADAAAARTAIGAGTSNLAIGTTGTTAKAGNYAPPTASTTTQGVVELATTTEATTGTDTARAVTPAGVKAVADTKVTGTGITEVRALTQAQYDALTPSATTLYVITDA